MVVRSNPLPIGGQSIKWDLMGKYWINSTKMLLAWHASLGHMGYVVKHHITQTR